MQVYADNAATTKISEAAKNEMILCMDEFFGNASSLHTVGQRAAEKLFEARKTIADCLNADVKDIYFTSGGSEADNQAILSAAAIGKRQGKMHIISTAFEHHAVLHTLKKLEKEFSSNQNLKEARKKFIDFTKNLWIQEVTENEVGSNINFKLNKVFELDRLYYEIKTKYDILYKNLNIEKYTKSTIVIAGVLVALLIFNILNYINMIK